jgi:flavoprotein
MGETGGMRPLGWPAYSKVDLRKRLLGGIDWSGLTQDMEQCETCEHSIESAGPTGLRYEERDNGLFLSACEGCSHTGSKLCSQSV